MKKINLLNETHDFIQILNYTLTKDPKQQGFRFQIGVKLELGSDDQRRTNRFWVPLRTNWFQKPYKGPFNVTVVQGIKGCKADKFGRGLIFFVFLFLFFFQPWGVQNENARRTQNPQCVLQPPESCSPPNLVAPHLKPKTLLFRVLRQGVILISM